MCIFVCVFCKDYIYDVCVCVYFSGTQVVLHYVFLGLEKTKDKYTGQENTSELLELLQALDRHPHSSSTPQVPPMTPSLHRYSQQLSSIKEATVHIHLHLTHPCTKLVSPSLPPQHTPSTPQVLSTHTLHNIGTSYNTPPLYSFTHQPQHTSSTSQILFVALPSA